MKDEVGRRRYIAFRAPSDAPARRELDRRLDEPAWHLTVYDPSDIGILRVPHLDAEEAREALTALGAEPLTTSGTIERAKRRAGVAGA